MKNEVLKNRTEALTTFAGLDYSHILITFFAYKSDSLYHDDILEISRELLRYAHIRDRIGNERDLPFFSYDAVFDAKHDSDKTLEKLREAFSVMSMLPRTSVPATILSTYGSLIFPELFATSETKQFENPENDFIENCPFAEIYFMSWLLDPSSFLRRAAKMNVIVDKSNKPLFLEKLYFANSAITLQDIFVEGMLLPAGSLVGISRTGSERVQHSQNKSGTGQIIPYDKDNISGIIPLRYTPFIVEGKERAVVFYRQLQEYKYRFFKSSYQAYYKMTIADIMKICEEQIG